MKRVVVAQLCEHVQRIGGIAMCVCVCVQRLWKDDDIYPSSSVRGYLIERYERSDSDGKGEEMCSNSQFDYTRGQGILISIGRCG